MRGMWCSFSVGKRILVHFKVRSLIFRRSTFEESLRTT